MGTRNNPNRWDGWVSFAWILAALTIVGVLILVAKYGMVESYSVDRFGLRSLDREVNVFVWAVGIGQSIAAVMVAGLFSMVNSIYKNTCDPVATTTDQKALSSPDVDKGYAGASGVVITRIKESSPLFDKAYVGWKIVGVNGSAIEDPVDIAKFLVNGFNVIQLIDSKGRDEAFEVMVKNNQGLNLSVE